MNRAAGMRRALLIVAVLLVAPGLPAQTKPTPSRPATPSWPATPFKRNPQLNVAEKRGEHWFLQRCSICHLAAYTKADPAGEPNKGPSLEGLLKGAPPEREQAVREFIRKGSLNMPGFQYALEPKDLDELVAYIKTL